MAPRIATSAADAVAQITDGSTVLIGGFGNAGQPMELIDALMQCGATDLTVVNNNAGQADAGLALLIKERRVKKIICSFPRQSDSWHFDEAYRAGEIELELVPQGKESPIHADFALIKALRADTHGNLVYRKTARNFGPIMATAAAQAIVQVDEVVPVGGIDPENVITPGIYVDTVVALGGSN